MSVTILACPFCGYADVEICEVEPGRIAIDCPECECIGPFADTVDEAAELWNLPTVRLAALAETAALRGFARAVMEVWPDGDLDGGTLQDLAEKHGLLKPETRHEPCGDACSCNEYADPHEWEDGVVCYRKTALLTGFNVKVRRGPTTEGETK